jgi:hypothetical protein
MPKPRPPFRAISPIEWRTIQNKGQWNLTISVPVTKMEQEIAKLDSSGSS